MKKIVIIVVNYNGCDVTKNCFDSIQKNSVGVCHEFIVIDNFSSSDEQVRIGKLFEGTNATVIFLEKNYGYFRAINIGLIYAREKIGDIGLFIVGNNDLEFNKNLASSLTEIDRLESNVVVVAPNITNINGKAQNPHSIFGINRFREIIYNFYYCNYTMARLILIISRLLGSFARRDDRQTSNKSGFIKLGFGACYIIKPTFFDYFKALWAPMFLMGEELMFSRQLETRGIRVFYDSSINVRHLDSATISKIPSKIIWESARDSHKLYRTFINPCHVEMNAAVSTHWIEKCSGQLDYEKSIARLSNSKVLINGKFIQ
jgi:GT2 family glycosyltransferase